MMWNRLRTSCAVALLLFSVLCILPPVRSGRGKSQQPRTAFDVLVETSMSLVAVDTFLILIGQRRFLTHLMIELVLYPLVVSIFLFVAVRFSVAGPWKTIFQLVASFVVVGVVIACCSVILVDAVHEFRWARKKRRITK